MRISWSAARHFRACIRHQYADAKHYLVVVVSVFSCRITAVGASDSSRETKSHLMDEHKYLSTPAYWSFLPPRRKVLHQRAYGFPPFECHYPQSNRLGLLSWRTKTFVVLGPAVCARVSGGSAYIKNRRSLTTVTAATERHWQIKIVHTHVGVPPLRRTQVDRT